MCFATCDIAFVNYADDDTPYDAGDSTEHGTRKLKNDSIKLFKQFSGIQIKTNNDKRHFIASDNEHVSIKLNDIEIENSNSKCEKLFRIKIDSKLNFSRTT